MPPRHRASASFGIWSAATPGNDLYEFVCWLDEREVRPDLGLHVAAEVFAAKARHPGKYMVQVLNRGRSGSQLQALTFSIEERPVQPVYKAVFG